jgi:hypothetical protein
MPYFNKQEIEEFIKNSLEQADQNQVKLLTPFEQSLSQLKNEEDVVSFFYIVQTDPPTLSGSAFLRIDFDLYTNDRYALDAYAAAKNNKTIQEVISERKNGKNGNS